MPRSSATIYTSIDVIAQASRLFLCTLSGTITEKAFADGATRTLREGPPTVPMLLQALLINPFTVVLVAPSLRTERPVKVSNCKSLTL